MSRRREDNENPVQLFPFVAVLLCTMGALLVLLISVARSAKEHAEHAAVVQRAKAEAAAASRSQADLQKIAAAKQELAEIARYRAELQVERVRAATALRENQERLSHLEDHMRRLREQLATMQLAAAELNSLEGEHYDDREQAQREIERLQQLIADGQKLIEELKAEHNARSKSYAIVPYDGKNGTRRRPIYIECVGDEVILQPEGVRFPRGDFRPPIGPGSPLVAAIRAAREYIVQNEPPEAGKAAIPYPLLIVRPDGIESYYLAREAIQSWDSEFGYELVEQDWELKYSPADPQLALREYEAAELARGRLQALAEAAPHAYGAYRSGSGGGDDDYDFGFGGGAGGEGDWAAGEGEGYGSTSASSGSGSQHGGSNRLASAPGRGNAIVVIQRGNATGGSGNSEKGGTASGKPSPTADGPTGKTGSPTNSATASQASASKGGSSNPPDQPPMATLPAEEPPLDGKPNSGRISAGDDPEQQLDNMARAAAASDRDNAEQQRSKQKIRGKNWAIRHAGPGSIPIRRTVQVVVREDAVVILPEASSAKDGPAAGREFQYGDAPDEAFEGVLMAVDKRIDNWGMAGDGLYWRPVVELKVDAGAEHRLDELARRLQHSGADIRNGDVAQQSEGGTRGTNR
jgi:hypothetical protein